MSNLIFIYEFRLPVLFMSSETLNHSMNQYIINYFHIYGDYITGGCTERHEHRETEKREPQAEDVTTGKNPLQPFPCEGDYNAVRIYVEERKKHDEVFRLYCQTHSRKQLCERLSDEFGWEVNVDSYGKNVNRNP